jgi:3-isopropylmalate/(R)-2-methylmalate dehydratase small subunit
MAEPFESFTSRVIPFPAENVDTDQIIPARFLKTTDRWGLSEALFNDWRFEDDGTPKPEFVLNRREMQGRRILLSGDNFGCGSSREHAPWALTAWGIRAILSTSSPTSSAATR